MKRQTIALLTCAMVVLPAPGALAYQSPGGGPVEGKRGTGEETVGTVVRVSALIGLPRFDGLPLLPSEPPLPRWPSPGPADPGPDPSDPVPTPEPGRGSGEPPEPDEGGDGGENPDEGGHEDVRAGLERPFRPWSADPPAADPLPGWNDQEVGTFDLYEDDVEDAGDDLRGERRAAPSARQLLPVLPLGAGLACLGLGLASLALRLRR